MSKIYHEEGLWQGLYRFVRLLTSSKAYVDETKPVVVFWLTISLYQKLDFQSFKSEGLELV